MGQTPTNSTAGPDPVPRWAVGGQRGRRARHSGPRCREAMLQDKGDRLPSCHAGVQGWTLQEVPARHCLLHIPGYPLSSSCEPPNLMQKGLSGGKGLRTRRGPPAPGQGSGSTGVGGSRDKGRDVLAGSSSHSWAMLGAGGGDGTQPHRDTPLGHTWAPNKGAAAGTASPPTPPQTN